MARGEAGYFMLKFGLYTSSAYSYYLEMAAHIGNKYRKLPPGEKAGTQLQVRVKQQDLNAWKKKAKIEDKTLSKWVIGKLNE